MSEKKINLYPKKELLDLIEKGAEEESRSLNQYILMILKEFFKNSGDL